MGVEKNIIMRQFNGTDYDILYPKTTAEQIENVYTENQILSSGTTGKYQLPVGSLPDAVFNKLLEAMPWTLIQEYKTAGAYTWTAPDLYNGASYKIGVYMVGGGGSGAAYVNGSSVSYEGSGGGSGFGKNIELTATPGQQFNAVVGAGGTPRVVTTGIGDTGNEGGTTSFNNIVVRGGGVSPGNGQTYGEDGAFGGQGSLPTRVYRERLPKPFPIYGSCSVTSSGHSGESVKLAGGFSQSPRESQNWFDPTMITLASGGAQGQQMATMPDGTKGGDGATSNSTKAEDATGNGNGGGAIHLSFLPTGGITSGAGSDGMILIYAKAV